MTISCSVQGNGPDLVMVHGWGWRGEVWRPVARALARAHRVWLPDLPGHGGGETLAGAATLDALTDAVCTQVPGSAIWVGWSLGAQLALRAAARGYLRRLVLVGATPCFVQRDDWPHGVTRAWFDAFARDVESDAAHALTRFASLHLGQDSARALLRELRAGLVHEVGPSLAALQCLGDTDLRAEIPGVAVPTLVVHGDEDRIVPAAAGAWLVRAMPEARHVVIGQAGHAPFLSHGDRFVQLVSGFCQ